MNKELSLRLNEIYEFGVRHDSTNKDHSEQMLNITPDTGLFLSILIQATKARRVLEIGTSNGYSTMWIADALENSDGAVITVEVSSKKAELAKKNFAMSGLSECIELHIIDVQDFLESQDDDSFDIVFLDAERSQYVSYWNHIRRVLKSGGLLLVDNALSPRPEELADFFKLVDDSEEFLSQILKIGKGEFLALKYQL